MNCERGKKEVRRGARVSERALELQWDESFYVLALYKDIASETLDFPG